MKILWLKTELLHPVDKGGKIRTYQMLREMTRAGHAITYLTLDDGADAKAREQALEYCDEVVCIPHQTSAKFSLQFYAEVAGGTLSSLPYFMRKYKSKEMRRLIAERAREFDVIVCDFLMPSVNMPQNLNAAQLLFQHNVEAMIWKRHYEVNRHPLKKAFLYAEWRKTFAYERRACRRFDHVVAVSREDAEMMRREYGLSDVSDVPTGVDVEYFKPQSKAAAQPHSIVFTGSMDWLPNEDAISFFAEQIMPRVKRQTPDATLTVVGRNPSPRLVELSQRDSSIVVTGRVEDVRPYIERAAAYVVPLRIGGGTRLKIYEAMAMEKPLVSTRIGAEGLPLQDGVELLLADDPEEFARAVVRVLTDDELARTLGERAAQTVRERFTWRGVAGDFITACERAIEKRKEARGKSN